MRVRFSYLTDADIRELAREYGALRVIDGELAAPPPAPRGRLHEVAIR